VEDIIVVVRGGGGRGGVEPADLRDTLPFTTSAVAVAGRSSTSASTESDIRERRNGGVGTPAPLPLTAHSGRLPQSATATEISWSEPANEVLDRRIGAFGTVSEKFIDCWNPCDEKKYLN